MARKHKEEKIPKRHKIIMDQTSETHGVLLYQEQVIGVLRALGMDADNLTAFLKAVKASNADVGAAGEVIAGYEQMVSDMAHKAGMDSDDIKWMWDAFQAFAGYSFNKAHSVAYGITAYRCAYLATHHPVEFYAAVLAVAAGTPKEAQYVTAVRRADIRVLKPDVNISNSTYTVDYKRKCIRKGLMAIKGIGKKIADEIMEQRPIGGYKDLRELCMTVNRRRITGANAYLEDGDVSVGVIGKLAEAGALISLGIQQ
jgi:DNA polymerase-3 subunit alpha